MADQKGNRDGNREANREGNRDKQADENARNASGAGEPDDVAEDRNLSGASTWLTLPDQPADDSSASESGEGKSKGSKDSGDRQSNR
jgi:hypothetical protein